MRRVALLLATLALIAGLGSVSATGSTAEWAPVGEGLNSTVDSIAFANNGNLIAAGRFTEAGGVSANYIASWNGTAWSPLGSGLNGFASSATVSPDGDLYVGGDFTTPATRVASWDGANWSAVGTGFDDAVRSLAFDAQGTLYAGGTFTQTAGGVTVNKIAKWDGSLWSALGQAPDIGTNGTVEAVAVDSSGNVYVGGEFTTAGGVTVNNIARWDISTSTWSALGSGMDDDVEAVAVDSSGNVYAGGKFTTAGGVTVNNIAKWDGSSWTAVGAGLADRVYDIALASTGDIYAGGSFNSDDGDNIPDQIAVYSSGVTPAPPSNSTTSPQYTFSFLTSGGGPCLADVQVRRFERFTLPPASVACTPLGTSLAGWSIPGQDWAFAPGRVVTVVDSQVFTAVARKPEITITYDANVSMSDQCIANGSNIEQEADRSKTVSAPRADSTATLEATAPCTPPGNQLLGWRDTPNASGVDRSAAGQAYELGQDVPDAWNLETPDPVNAIHLYAIWGPQ